MYICLCNALTDKDIHRAAASGAQRPRDVYDSCNVRAQCGSCTGMILCALRTMLGEGAAEATPALPAAAG